MTKNNDIFAYNTSEDEDAKMDFLSDYDANPSDEFIEFLLNEFSNEEDEFLQIEIIKFVSTHRNKSNEIKNFLLKNIQSTEQYDEMVLSHLAQNLALFELKSDDFKIIYEQICEESKKDVKQENFISSLLRLLYVNRNKGAEAYLEALKAVFIEYCNENG